MAGDPGRKGQFRRADRVRKRREFDRAYRTGLRLGGGLMSWLFVMNARDHARLGISVSRRLGGAVVRNRLKRQIREAFRQHPQLRGNPVDVVVTVKPAAVGARFEAIRGELEKTSRQLQRRLRTR